MAKATSKKAVKKTAKKESAFPSTLDVREATFSVIAAKGYGKVRISDLSEHFNVPFVDFYHRYPSVDVIIEEFLDSIDHEMIKNTGALGDSNKRDIYFDMLMARMDALQEYRAGAVRWLQDIAKQPFLLARLLKRWEKSLSLMLDMAKDSPVFAVKKTGLAGVYLYTLHAWTKDDTTDLAKTMAALDQALGRAEGFVDKFLTHRKKT